MRPTQDYIDSYNSNIKLIKESAQKDFEKLPDYMELMPAELRNIPRFQELWTDYVRQVLYFHAGFGLDFMADHYLRSKKRFAKGERDRHEATQAAFATLTKDLKTYDKVFDMEHGYFADILERKIQAA